MAHVMLSVLQVLFVGSAQANHDPAYDGSYDKDYEEESDISYKVYHASVGSGTDKVHFKYPEECTGTVFTTCEMAFSKDDPGSLRQGLDGGGEDLEFLSKLKITEYSYEVYQTDLQSESPEKKVKQNVPYSLRSDEGQIEWIFTIKFQGGWKPNCNSDPSKGTDDCEYKERYIVFDENQTDKVLLKYYEYDSGLTRENAIVLGKTANGKYYLRPYHDQSKAICLGKQQQFVWADPARAKDKAIVSLDEIEEDHFDGGSGDGKGSGSTGYDPAPTPDPYPSPSPAPKTSLSEESTVDLPYHDGLGDSTAQEFPTAPSESDKKMRREVLKANQTSMHVKAHGTFSRVSTGSH